MLYSPVHVAIAEVGSVRSGHAGGPALVETVELAVGITLRAAHTDKNKCTNYLCSKRTKSEISPKTAKSFPFLQY